jgi:hypothetical protein
MLNKLGYPRSLRDIDVHDIHHPLIHLPNAGPLIHAVLNSSLNRNSRPLPVTLQTLSIHL